MSCVPSDAAGVVEAVSAGVSDISPGERGAHHAVNHRAPDHEQDIRRLTNDRGVDVILEMLANVNLANDLMAAGGRVVV